MKKLIIAEFKNLRKFPNLNMSNGSMILHMCKKNEQLNSSIYILPILTTQKLKVGINKFDNTMRFFYTDHSCRVVNAVTSEMLAVFQDLLYVYLWFKLINHNNYFYSHMN